ncbi:MAG: hypothetical protein WAP47_00010 [Candidatus Rokuibacteriota bacterium]
MNVYELEWLVKDRLDQARQYAARNAMIRLALADRPTLRLRLGALFIRVGTWLQARAAEPDAEAKRAAA